MPDENLSLDAIEDFLAQKRIAMVGMSREPRNISILLFEEMYRRGYDIVPVNPNTQEILGRRCFARVQDIQPPVDGALLMTTPEVTDAVVKDCAEAGIRRVWMYRGGGKGAVSPQAVQFCEERGIEVVPGECPFMFWRDAAAVHRVHGFIQKITGHYPRRASVSSARAA
jgi:predicted CoA-binding protein